MVKRYTVKKITAESVNRQGGKKKWYITLSKELANRYAKAAGNNKIIYRLPNGAYALRRSKNVEGYPKGVFKRKK